MIVRVFDKAPTSECALKYNLTKYSRGASVFVGEESTARLAIEQIREYERNPFLWPGASSLGFHMAINPCPSDGVLEANVQDLAGSLLEAIGMDGQPWVLFKEDDREHNARVHYHLVSTRARKDGHTVHLSQYKKLQQAYKEWTIARGLPASGKFQWDSSNQKFVEPFTFDSRLEKTSQLRFALETALEYDFDGFQEFAAILRTMNVGVKVSSQRKKDSLLFYGINKKGKSCTHLYSHIDKDGAKLSKVMHHHRKQANLQDIEEICSLIGEVVSKCENYSQFEEQLKELGIYIDGGEELRLIDVYNQSVIPKTLLKEGMDPLFYRFIIDSEEKYWPDKSLLLWEYNAEESECSTTKVVSNKPILR